MQTTTITAPVFSGQSIEDYLRKLFSYNGSFSQLEKKVSSYIEKFKITPDTGKSLTTPLCELKKSFYDFFNHKVTSLVENLEIGLLPDKMDGVTGYVQATIETRKLASKLIEWDKKKPWNEYKDKSDEVERIQTFLNELNILLDNLKQSVGGGWGDY